MDENLNTFEQTIKQYLDEQAAKDAAFAEKYRAEGKSIKECCQYIIGWVKESKREGFADAEIYGQALHYYDEKDIKVEKQEGCHVVVNHTIELSETEKRKAEQAARARYEAEELRKLKEARKKKAAKQTQPQGQMSDLFAGLL